VLWGHGADLRVRRVGDLVRVRRSRPEVVDGLIFVFDRAAYEQALGERTWSEPTRLC